MHTTMQTHAYDQEQAQAILRRALAQQQEQSELSQPGAFSHEQLRQMAAELGVEAAALDRAARDWSAEERDARERRRFVARRRREFLAHLAPYLLVSALLVAINLLSGARHFWAIWPLLGWGIGILSHGMCALRTSGEGFEREFRQWRQSERARRQASAAGESGARAGTTA